MYDYGDGSGPVHFADIHCIGNETHLVNCSVDEDITISLYCDNAGVRCPNGIIINLIPSIIELTTFCFQSPALKVKSDSTIMPFKYVITNNGLMCVHNLVAFPTVPQK